jgi:hypothetical protein
MQNIIRQTDSIVNSQALDESAKVAILAQKIKEMA